MVLNPEPFETAGKRLWELLARWMVMALAVWISTLMPGVTYDDGPSLLAAALILGILNALVKPKLVAFALPLVILSLGFILLFINAFLLLLTARLVPGFHVSGFWTAMGASLIISFISMVLGNNGIRTKRTPRPPSREAFSEPAPTRTPPPGKGPIIDV